MRAGLTSSVGRTLPSSRSRSQASPASRRCRSHANQPQIDPAREFLIEHTQQVVTPHLIRVCEPEAESSRRQVSHVRFQDQLCCIVMCCVLVLDLPFSEGRPIEDCLESWPSRRWRKIITERFTLFFFATLFDLIEICCRSRELLLRFKNDTRPQISFASLDMDGGPSVSLA